MFPLTVVNYTVIVKKRAGCVFDFVNSIYSKLSSTIVHYIHEGK